MKTKVKVLRGYVKMILMENTSVVVPEYIHEILYDLGGIKGATLHAMIDAAIQKDGKVPTESEWSQMVDSVSDGMTDLELQEVYPAVTEVLMDFFIP